MRILVTGATGFLGSHLCRELVRRGHQIVALRRESSNLQHLEGLGLEFRTADLNRPESLTSIVEGQEAVIHAAAEINYSANPQLQHRTNVEATAVLASACREHGVRRLLYISSVAAIGIPPRGSIADESFRFNLQGSRLYYHLSKKRAEDAVLEECRRGLDAVIVSPASIFGPHGPAFRGGEMIYKIQRSSVVPYFTGGICTVHVDDVVEGAISALEHGTPGERYILGGENLTYKELAQRAAAALRVKRHFVPVWPVVTATANLLLPGFSYTRHFTAGCSQFYSSAKAQRALGYSPRPFAAILQQCLESFGADSSSRPCIAVRAAGSADTR